MIRFSSAAAAALLALSACKHVDSNASEVKLKAGLEQVLNLSADPEMAQRLCTEQMVLMFVGNAESLGEVYIPPHLEPLFGDALVANWRLAENHRKIEYHAFVRGQLKALIKALAKAETGCLGNAAVRAAWKRDGSYGAVTLFSLLDGPNVRLNTVRHTYEATAADSMIASWRFHFTEDADGQAAWTVEAPLYWSFKDGKLTPAAGQTGQRLSAADLAAAVAAIDRPEALPVQQEFYMPDAVDAMLAAVRDPAFLRGRLGVDRASRYLYFMKGHGGLVSEYDGLTPQVRGAVETAIADQGSKGSVFLFDPHGPAGDVQATDFYSPLWDPEAVCRAVHRGETLGAVLACQDDVRSGAYLEAKKAADLDKLGNAAQVDGLIGRLSVTSNESLSGFDQPGQSSLARPPQPLQALIAGGVQGPPLEGGQGGPLEGGQGSPLEGQGSPLEGQGSPLEGQGSPLEGQGLDGLTLGQGFWRGGAQGAKTMVCSSRSKLYTPAASSMGTYGHPLTQTMVASDARDPVSSRLLEGAIRLTTAPMAFRFMGKAKAISQLALADPLKLVGGAKPSFVVFDTCYANMAPLEGDRVLPWTSADSSVDRTNWVVLANPIPVLEDALNYGLLTGFQYAYLTELLKGGIAAGAGQKPAAPASTPAAVPPPLLPPGVEIDPPTASQSPSQAQTASASDADSALSSQSRIQAAEAIAILLGDAAAGGRVVDDSIRKRRLHAFLFDCTAGRPCAVTNASSDVLAFDQMAALSQELVDLTGKARVSREWFDLRLIQAIHDYGANLSQATEVWLAHDKSVTPAESQLARIGEQVAQRLARFSYSFDVPDATQNYFLDLMASYYGHAAADLGSLRKDSSPAPLLFRKELYQLGILHYAFTARDFLQINNPDIFTGKTTPYDETKSTMTPFRPISDLLRAVAAVSSEDLKAIAPSKELVDAVAAAERDKDLMKQWQLLIAYVGKWPAI